MRSIIPIVLKLFIALPIPQSKCQILIHGSIPVCDLEAAARWIFSGCYILVWKHLIRICLCGLSQLLRGRAHLNQLEILHLAPLELALHVGQHSLASHHLIQHWLYWRHLEVGGVGVVSGGKVEGRGETLPGVCFIIDTVRVVGGMMGGRWESLIKSIDNPEYLVQIWGLLIHTQLFHHRGVVLSDGHLTVNHCCGHFEHWTCHCP